MTEPIGLHTVHVQHRWFKYILIESVIRSTDTNCFNTVFVIHHYWPSTSNTSSVSADSAFDRYEHCGHNSSTLRHYIVVH